MRVAPLIAVAGLLASCTPTPPPLTTVSSRQSALGLTSVSKAAMSRYIKCNGDASVRLATRDADVDLLADQAASSCDDEERAFRLAMVTALGPIDGARFASDSVAKNHSFNVSVIQKVRQQNIEKVFTETQPEPDLLKPPPGRRSF
jgi:hypothetical protein